jgi:hypothetical protein
MRHLIGAVAVLAAVVGCAPAPSVTNRLTSSAIPTREAAVATPSPARTSSPTPASTSSPPTATPRLTPTPQTPVPVPPKPTDVEFDEQQSLDSEGNSTGITQTVTWGAPKSPDVEIRVYGVTDCIARPEDPAPDTSGPCLVTGTPLPAAVRTLLATASASEGSVSWTWPGAFECGETNPASDPEGPAYFAIVLAAYNSSGHSIFAIAAPGRWMEPGADEIIC